MKNKNLYEKVLQYFGDWKIEGLYVKDIPFLNDLVECIQKETTGISRIDEDGNICFADDICKTCVEYEDLKKASCFRICGNCIYDPYRRDLYKEKIEDEKSN